MAGRDVPRLPELEPRGARHAKPKASPQGWTGNPPYIGLGWRGPVANAAREIDVGTLINGLAAIVLQRELEKIEAFEADISERVPPQPAPRPRPAARASEAGGRGGRPPRRGRGSAPGRGGECPPRGGGGGRRAPPRKQRAGPRKPPARRALRQQQEAERARAPAGMPPPIDIRPAPQLQPPG